MTRRSRETLILGIDPSYSRPGFAVVSRSGLIHVDSYDLNRLSTNSCRRLAMQSLVRAYVARFDPSLVIVERTRLFSQRFISLGTTSALGALIAVIVDASQRPCLSVETREWRYAIHGPLPRGLPTNTLKQLSVDLIVQKYGRQVDHDAAEAVCLALYPFVCKENGRKLRLKSEK